MKFKLFNLFVALLIFKETYEILNISSNLKNRLNIENKEKVNYKRIRIKKHRIYQIKK